MIKLSVKDILRNTNAKLLNGNENEIINNPCCENIHDISE